MELEYPWVFAVAAGLFVIVTLAAILIPVKSGKGVGLKAAHTRRLRELPAFKKALSKRRIALVIATLAVLFALSSSAFVAARPTTKVIENPVKYNRDIVLCLDVSGSMIEVDIQIINKFYELLNEFNGERVSLVVFNSVANQVFPLTDDYAYVSKQLDYVLDGFYVDTAYRGFDIVKYTIADHGASLIGDGLTSCTMSFDTDDEQRSRSVILATDNVVNGKPIVALDEAVGLAKSKGIRVYGINPGSIDWETKEPLPDLEAEMRAASESTGGKYFALDQLDSVSGIVNDITNDAASAVRSDPIVVKNDDPAIYIWILLFLSIPAIVFFRRIS